MINKFMALKAKIDEQLAQLQQASNEHFNVHPDKVDYGDLGDLERLSKDLQDIIDYTT